MRFRIITFASTALAVLAVTSVVGGYTPAFTHVPHVEDYPVMTTESAHFNIEPDVKKRRAPLTGCAPLRAVTCGAPALGAWPRCP